MRYVMLSLAVFAMFPGCARYDYLDGNVAEQDFPSDWAEVWCARQKSCDKGTYEEQWTSADDCRQEKSSDAEFATDWGDLLCGDYSEEDAVRCLGDMNSMSCEDWKDGDWRDNCGDAYGC